MLSQTFFSLTIVPRASPDSLGGAQERRLPNEYKHQEQTEWCWAACMQMVLQANGTKVTQCALANAALALTGCCEHPSSSLCNKPLPVFSISAEWARFHHRATFVDASVPFKTVISEIRDNNNPVEVGLKWAMNRGGHAVLIVGYSEADAEDVIVLDPMEGERAITYNELVKAYNRGEWRWSWTGVKPDGTV